MNGRWFVVAAGNVEDVLARAGAAVIERVSNAVLLEATAAEASALRCTGARISVFRNPAIARTAFGLYDR